MSKQLNSPSFLESWSKETNIPLLQNASLLRETSSDFGHLCIGDCTAIAMPTTIKELSALIRFANHNHITLTPRALGLSQSGQSIPANNGLSLQLSKMPVIKKMDVKKQQIYCASHLTWREVLKETMPHGLMPKVVPLNIDLSVAGTLSVGGMGATSHSHGLIINNVASMEVITGSGDAVNCSAENEPDLFHATLGGLGRFSIMTHVNLPLRPFKKNTRTFYLLYDDQTAWLEDQKQLAKAKQCHYLESFCSASTQGLHNTPHGRKPLVHWFYPLHVSFEYEEGQAPDVSILKNCHYWKVVHIEDVKTTDYFDRYAPRFALMHQSGAWELPHPWFECLLPFDTTKDLLKTILGMLPLSLGDGHRVLYIANRNNAHDFFMHPNKGQDSMLFAALPMGIPAYQLQTTLDAIKQIHELVINAGGKRSLSGWIHMMDKTAWEKHYADNYSKLWTIKKKFDPNNILQSCLNPIF